MGNKRNRRTDKADVKGHILQLWELILWAKSNPWVFGILVIFYSSLASGVLLIATKALRPVVVPMIERKFQKEIIPYDSIVSNFDTRIKNLESQVFPLAQ